jgi:predicted phosphoribosyltransferase
MGAVASGGVRVVYEPVLRELRVTRREFDATTEREVEEIRRRERAYRDGRPFPDLKARRDPPCWPPSSRCGSSPRPR